MKRLLVEELERREMLSAAQMTAMASSAMTTNSVQDFYKSQVGTEIGGAAGVGMFDANIGPQASSFRTWTSEVIVDGRGSFSVDPNTGVGQLTITTGANTPGIGSFATPTAGPSRAGGTGNPNLPIGPALAADAAKGAATDAAIESLAAEGENRSMAEGDSDSKPRDGSQGVRGEKAVVGSKPTARRAWNVEPDEAEADQASPVGAGADR